MKVTRIKMRLNPSTKVEIIRFLKENLDVFAWSHEDIFGISEDVI